MKRPVLLLLLLISVLVGFQVADSQTGYTVAIDVEDLWWQSTENWGVTMEAVISYNGTPIPSSGDYYYEWWVYFSHEGYWRTMLTGMGEDEVTPETFPGGTIRSYVVVTDVENQTFTGIQSDPEGPFSGPGSLAKGVTFTPLQENGTHIYGVSAKHWRYTIDEWRDYWAILTLNTDATVYSTPFYVSPLAQKVRYWNGVVTDVENHNSFYINSSVSTLSPRYWSVNSTASVKAVLWDAPGSGIGDIEFHDPWYVDLQDANYGNNWRNRGMADPKQYRVRSAGMSGFKPDTSTTYSGGPYPYYGVFLNQQINSGLYYSVGAPNPNTFSVGGVNHQAYFLSWSGSAADVEYQSASSTRTGVMFKQSGAVATALYKTHLASNVSSVLGNNGQRRMTSKMDGSETVLIYASAGEIWSSADIGSGFGPEVRVSSGNGNNELPSITSRASDNKQHAVWRRNAGGGTYAICYAQRNNGVWSAPITVGYAYGVAPIPLITIKADYGYTFSNAPIHILYNEYSTLYRLKRSTDGGSSWSSYSGLTMGLAEQSVSPLESYDDVPTTLSLAYKQSGAVKYQNLVTTWSGEMMVPGSGSVPHWFEALFGAELTGNYPQGPQVARYDGRTYFAWNHKQQYTWDYIDFIDVTHMVYQERDAYGNWSSATAFLASEGGAASNPTLTVLSSEKPVFEWETGGYTVRARRASGQWSTSSQGSGYDPELSISGGAQASSAQRLCRNTSGGLYTIEPQATQVTRVLGKTSQDQVPKTMAEEVAGLKYTRVLSVVDTVTGATYSVAASIPRLNDRELGFYPVNDTLPGIGRNNFFLFLSSETVQSERAGDVAMVEVHTYSKGWDKDASSLRLEVTFGDGLTAGGLETEAAGGSDRLLASRTSELNAPIGLSMSGDLPPDDGNLVYMLTHVYSPNTVNPRRTMQDPPSKPDRNLSPDEFFVHQNYPNPFNPSTTIRFGLSEPAQVRAAVYDLLGREIAVLLDAPRSTGYHIINWNAEGHPTGTYICRLRILESNGQQLERSIRMQYVR